LTNNSTQKPNGHWSWISIGLDKRSVNPAICKQQIPWLGSHGVKDPWSWNIYSVWTFNGSCKFGWRL